MDLIRRLQDNSSFCVALENCKAVPISLQKILSAAFERGCLPETSRVLASQTRTIHEHARRGRLSSTYIAMVSLLAWCGFLFSFTAVIPLLVETISQDALSRPWWAEWLDAIRSWIGLWGIAIPGFAICLLVLRRRRRLRREMDFHSHRPLLTCELANQLFQRWKPKVAIQNACSIFATEPKAIDPFIGELSEGDADEDLLLSQWMGVSEWLFRKREREQRWWTENLPSALVLLLAFLIVTTYVSIGAAAWFFTIYRGVEMLNLSSS